jgi:hypothetical protein
MLADAHGGGHFSGKPADGFGRPDQQALSVLFLILLFSFRHVSGSCTPGARTMKFPEARIQVKFRREST